MRKDSFVVFMALLVIFMSLSRFYVIREEDRLKYYAEYYAENISSRFTDIFKSYALVSSEAEDFVLLHEKSLSSFFKSAERCIKKLDGIKSLHYISSDGESYSFPSKASVIWNEEDAQLARESHRDVISGPYNMYGNKKIFVIFHPVYEKNQSEVKFYGYILQDIFLDELFDIENFRKILGDKTHFRVFKEEIPDEKTFIVENTSSKLDNSVDHHFMMGQKLWTILIKPSYGWRPGFFVYVGISSLFAIIFTILYYFVLSAFSSNRALKVQAETLKSVSFREKTLRNTYEAAIESASLFLWELNLEDGSAVLLNNPFTIEFSKKHNIPHVIPDLYAFVRTLVSESDYAILDDISSRVRSGEKKVSSTLRLKSELLGNFYTIKITYSVDFDENDNPVRAYGTGQDVTENSVMQDAYYQELSFFHSYNGSDVKFRMRFNLSKDILLESSPKRQELTFTEFIKSCSIPEEYKLSRSYILKKYLEGERTITREFFNKEIDENGLWLLVDCKLLASPVTSDVEMFIYVYDNTKTKNEQLIINRLTRFFYEVIAIVNVSSGYYKVFAANKDSPMLNKFGDYGDFIKNLNYDFMLPQEKEHDVEMLSIKNICEKLSDSNLFIHSVNFKSPAEEKMRKLFQFCYLDDSKTLLLLFIYDITDQYKKDLLQMQELRNALNDAEIANRAKSEFVSRISHDIRTPIGAIQNLTKFAKSDIDDKNLLSRDLERIESSSQFLLSLINDVLDISKLDSGVIVLNPEPFNFKDFKAGIENIMEPMCSEKNIEFNIDMTNSHADITPVVDKIRLNQITLNILSNAVKYTQEGGRIQYISNSSILPDGNFILGYKVIDNGIGMSKQFQQHMFEDFTQEYDNVNRPKGISGTGLGLSIVKKMLTLMGGTIDIQSELGEGTSVTVSIPVKYIGENKLKSGIYGEKVDDEFYFDGKILLTEDNEINSEIMLRILEGMCSNIVHVENGEKAVNAFLDSEENEYSLILMDIQMPVMDGYEATKRIRNSSRLDGKKVYIAAMTADAFDEAKQKAKDAGVNSFLTKPIDPEKLKELLKEVSLKIKEERIDG